MNFPNPMEPRRDNYLPFVSVAPAGTFPAVIVLMREFVGVTVEDRDNPGVMKIVDQICGVVGIGKPSSGLFLAESRHGMLSSNEKSGIYKLASAALNGNIQYGLNLKELEGKPIMATIANVVALKSQRPYAKITGVSPLPQEFLSAAPKKEWFDELVAEAIARSSRPPGGGAPPLRPTPSAKPAVVAPMPPIPSVPPPRPAAPPNAPSKEVPFY